MLLRALGLLSLGLLLGLLLAEEHGAEEHEISDFAKPAANVSGNASANASKGHKVHAHHGVHVASWRFHFVDTPFIITSFVMAVVVVKVIWEHFHTLAGALPESCLLIVLGLVLGGVFLLDAEKNYELLVFDPDTFFLYLLPPIILEASYSLKDRAFAENFGTIILYAVVGTLLNAGLTGLGLYGIKAVGAMGGLDISFLDCLIFAALISAVDPVAVLAIFQELGVNKMLYFMVFGESLLNDAVTVVLYTVLVTFARMDEITPGDVGLGVLAFLASSFGAIIIGTLFGLATGFITKYTGKIRVVEPTTLFGMAYLAYLSAELFHFSGIIAIISCGLVQAHYAMENISSKSYVTVQYFSKVLSSVTESLIFLILGVMLVNDRHYWKSWNTPFALYSLALVLVSRTLVVFGLTAVVNWLLAGIRKVSVAEQCIMAYGGLRGVVSFALVFMLRKEDVAAKDPLMCATYLIILFTVFVQGSTIKPLVKLLQIQLEDKEVTMWHEVNRNLVDYMTTGMEEVSGHHGERFFAALSHHFSRRFLRPILQKNPTSTGKNLLNTYVECNIQSSSREGPGQGGGRGLVPSGSAIFDQLTMLDQSAVQNSMASIMLDNQDESKRRRTPTHGSAGNLLSPNSVASPAKVARSVKVADPEATHMDGPPKPKRSHSIRELRQLLATPLHKRMHYAAGDRNLRTAVSQNHRSTMNHLLETRRKAAKRFSLKGPSHKGPLVAAAASKRRLTLAGGEEETLQDLHERTEEEEKEASSSARKESRETSPPEKEEKEVEAGEESGDDETPFLTPKLTLSPPTPAHAAPRLPVQFTIDEVGADEDSD